MTSLLLKIEGMHCEGCANRLTGVLKNLDGVSNAEVSLEKKCADISFDEEVLDQDEIEETICDAGFKVVK